MTVGWHCVSCEEVGCCWLLLRSLPLGWQVRLKLASSDLVLLDVEAGCDHLCDAVDPIMRDTVSYVDRGLGSTVDPPQGIPATSGMCWRPLFSDQLRVPPLAGFEPTTSRTEVRCATTAPLPHRHSTRNASSTYVANDGRKEENFQIEQPEIPSGTI